jgi:glycine cleavage system H protein
MSQIPADLRYAKSHEWVRLATDGTAHVGITDFAQAALGDITYVQLPKLGVRLDAGQIFGVVESVKAASDLYLPVAGTVLEVNAALVSVPETINQSPYGHGWILKLELTAPADVTGLLDPRAYEKLLA